MSYWASIGKMLIKAVDCIVWANPVLPLCGIGKMEATSWREMKMASRRGRFSSQSTVEAFPDNVARPAESLAALNTYRLAGAERLIELRLGRDAVMAVATPQLGSERLLVGEGTSFR